MALNKFAFHNILAQEMDAPSSTAEKLADLIDEANDELVTKQDLAATEARLRNELADFRAEYLAEMNRHLRWLMTAAITLGGAMIGLLAFIATKI